MLNKKRTNLAKINKNETFLSKLYDILNIKSYEKLIHWSEDGNEIIIADMINLSKVILPKYYKHHNYSSFVRQLNMYNFKKIKDKSKNNEERFENSEFKKSTRKEEVQNISRKRKKAKCKILNNRNINININSPTDTLNDVDSINNNTISKSNIVNNKILNYLIAKNEENIKSLTHLEKEVESLKKQNTHLTSQIQLYNSSTITQDHFFKKMKGLLIFLLALIMKKPKTSYKICHLDVNQTGLTKKMSSLKDIVYKYIYFQLGKQVQSPTNSNNSCLVNNKVEKEISFCINTNENNNLNKLFCSDNISIKSNIFNDSFYDDLPFFNYHHNPEFNLKKN